MWHPWARCEPMPVSPFQGVKLVPALYGWTGWHWPCMGCRAYTWSHHHEVIAHLGDNSHQGWVSSQAGSWLGVKSVNGRRCKAANSAVHQVQCLLTLTLDSCFPYLNDCRKWVRSTSCPEISKNPEDYDINVLLLGPWERGPITHMSCPSVCLSWKMQFLSGGLWIWKGSKSLEKWGFCQGEEDLGVLKNEVLVRVSGRDQGGRVGGLRRWVLEGAQEWALGILKNAVLVRNSGIQEFFKSEYLERRYGAKTAFFKIPK